MILPPGVTGVAFSDSSDGDLRNDPAARSSLSAALGVPDRWATVGQVHGTTVVRSEGPGARQGADAVWTTTPGLPVAVFTADCLGVVLLADAAVGVAHAGWRGAAGGVVGALVDDMSASGHRPSRVVIGPGIGPCCFEVGDEVAALFPGHASTTTWGTRSVDLAAVVTAQVDGPEVEVVGGCTGHEDRFFSHRRDRSPRRQVALGWLP